MEELTTSPGAVSEVFTTLGQELGIAFKEHFEQLMNHLDATELLAITDAGTSPQDRPHRGHPHHARQSF